MKCLVKCCKKGRKKVKDIFTLAPHKRKRNWLRVLLALMLLLLFAVVALFFFKPFGISVDAPVAAAIGAVLAAIVTFLCNEISKEKLVIWNGRAVINLYKSEIDDLIRHLEAGAEILIQIRKELKAGATHVDDIHFTNLKWPESSIVFSDEMAKLITHDRVNDFTRLKVNIRNLNNFAGWLCDLARQGERLDEAVEWVITRHFGYIVNLYYMQSHGYRLPDEATLECYVAGGCVECMGEEMALKERLSRLFKDYGVAERRSEVEAFLERYWADRREKRCVFVKG